MEENKQSDTGSAGAVDTSLASRLKIILESTWQRFNTISAADNTVDQKCGTLMGFEITIVIGVLTFLFNRLSGVKLAEAIGAVVVLVASIVILLIASWPKKYLGITVNMQDNQEYLNKKETDLFLQMIKDGELAIKNNSRILKLKASLFNAASILLIISFVFLILSLLGKIYV